MNDTPKKRSTKAVVNENGERVTPVRGHPAANRYEAPPCTACRSSDTFVASTRWIARYCKCRHCGHSWPVYRNPVTIDDIQTR